MLPLGPGHTAARTHDCRRKGKTTLHAALNLTEPEVPGHYDIDKYGTEN